MASLAASKAEVEVPRQYQRLRCYGCIAGSVLPPSGVYSAVQGRSLGKWPDRELGGSVSDNSLFNGGHEPPGEGERMERSSGDADAAEGENVPELADGVGVRRVD